MGSKAGRDAAHRVSMIFHRASVSLLPVRWRFTGGQRSRANTGKSSSRLGLRALHREQLGTWAPRSISRAARASRLRQLPWSTESSSSLWAPRSPLDRIGIAVDVPKRRASYAQVCAPVVFEWIARYECENPNVSVSCIVPGPARVPHIDPERLVHLTGN